MSWQYQANPYAQGYRHYVAVQDGVILAQLGTIQMEMWVQGECIPGCWLVDFMVRPQYRNRALGALLLRQLIEDFPICMALGMTDAAVTIYRRLGWVDLGESSFWWRILRWTPLLATYPRLRSVAPLLGPLANLADRTLRLSRPAWRGSHVLVEAISSFDDSFRPWLEEVQRDYPILATRSVSYLNWRYMDKPGTHYRLLAAHRDGYLTGYGVLAQSRFRDSLSMGVIVDLLTRKADEEARQALLQAAVAYFNHLGMAIVSCNTTCRTLQTSLRIAGFRHYGIGQRLMVDLSGTDRLAEAMAIPENWFITRGDADGDNGCW